MYPKKIEMFASLKNKIREETGSDISKLTQKITSSTVQRIDSLRGRSSHGSTSSINSIVSSDGIREESLDPNRSEEEAKRKISRIENEFARKLEDKEREWREIVGEKDKRMLAMEREKEEALKQIANLKDSLRSAEGDHILYFNNINISRIFGDIFVKSTKICSLNLCKENKFKEIY